MKRGQEFTRFAWVDGIDEEIKDQGDRRKRKQLANIETAGDVEVEVEGDQTG